MKIDQDEIQALINQVRKVTGPEDMVLIEVAFKQHRTSDAIRVEWSAYSHVASVGFKRADTAQEAVKLLLAQEPAQLLAQAQELRTKAKTLENSARLFLEAENPAVAIHSGAEQETQ